MRHTIVAGNWKMHKTYQETHKLLDELIEKLPTGKEVEVIVAPAFTNLGSAVAHLDGTNIQVAAQNMHQAEGGAFTGEVSAQMLKSVNVETVIIGHSERRHYFHETDAILADKVNTALRHDMRVIFCIGEELKDRENKQFLNVIFNQLTDGLFHLTKEQWANIVIAYEPVWAIGTGMTATPEQVQEMHAFIRREIERKYDLNVANSTSILYGGSVKPSNAQELFANPDVDGGLIGGAALIADDFAAIVNAAE
ncbi:triose-phosphate isomerase [Myroides pelagicus]|uniref:Triosephosphate isomerase n=1 Tax=Myroides pelagicus TaxID=270914 RepID=A0A7K1GPF9_9FLAO|nr:triose-phosphate isomerase [Myroides pelagicus]MEC4113843.1 triose-phosphate isomerase [Myroides pelagicus]MTH30658.1 triose-phosphate isomerase [Myroides pelagicus]